MKTSVVLIVAMFGAVFGQFTSNSQRVLEPPVPALCAQRIIHERAPDGKIHFFILGLNFNVQKHSCKMLTSRKYRYFRSCKTCMKKVNHAQVSFKLRTSGPRGTDNF